jgi:hypothetical protein
VVTKQQKEMAMKKFIALLAAAVLIVSTLGVMTAFAGFSVPNASSGIKAGKTYTYTVKVTASGIDMFGNVNCGGVFSGSAVQFKAEGSGAQNESLSASVKITVTVSSSAKPGDTGTIYLSAASYSYYDDSGNVQESGIDGSKTFTVPEPCAVALYKFSCNTRFVLRIGTDYIIYI